MGQGVGVGGMDCPPLPTFLECKGQVQKLLSSSVSWRLPGVRVLMHVSCGNLDFLMKTVTYHAERPSRPQVSKEAIRS